MTEFVFRADSYLKRLDAEVTEVAPEGGIVVDRTIFYAASGGQPNDTGRIVASDGRVVPIVNVVHPEGDKTRVRLVHRGLPADAVEDHGRGWAHYLERLSIAAAGGDTGPDIAGPS